MAAYLSTNHFADAAELAEWIECLRRRVSPLAQEDATAYGHVLAAYPAPHDSDLDTRRERIRRALSGVADRRWPWASSSG